MDAIYKKVTVLNQNKNGEVLIVTLRRKSHRVAHEKPRLLLRPLNTAVADEKYFYHCCITSHFLVFLGISDFAIFEQSVCRYTCGCVKYKTKKFSFSLNYL